MSDSRSHILADIAQALAKHPVKAGASTADSTAYPRPELEPAGSEATLQRFSENLTKAGGECHILKDEEAALSQLRAILGECHGQSVLVPPDAEIERMAVSRIVLETGCLAVNPQQNSLDMASRAAIGITVAYCGIADTGTLCLIHATLADQLSGLLPPIHLVLLNQRSIYSDKASFLTVMKIGGVDLGTMKMTWVTGPSLTADIEKVLVRGAHGPRRVVVLVY